MALSNMQLTNKYKKAVDALKPLEQANNDIKKAAQVAKCAQQDPKDMYRIYRDSLVQRFEYTFDTTWKYLAEYLQSQGRILEIKTPKSVFRESLKAKILSAADVRLALKMVDHRNQTTHGYNEELIEEIIQYIPKYVTLLALILRRTQSDD